MSSTSALNTLLASTSSSVRVSCSRILSMHLPQELLDHIFSFLRHSRWGHRALSACSLVSSSWTDPAHRGLFHHLEYIRGEQVEPDFPSLLRFLENSPSVAKHVRILYLHGGGDISQNPYWGTLDPQTFAGIISALPGLLDVTLKKTVLLPSPSLNPDFTEPSVPHIIPKPLRALSLSSLRPEGTGSLSALLTLLQYLRPFSSVQTLFFFLTYSDCDLETINNVQAVCNTLELPTNLGIETLDFAAESHMVLLPLEIVRRASPPSLRKLAFYDSGEGRNIEVLQGLLDDVGAGLEDLTIFLSETQSKYHKYPC